MKKQMLLGAVLVCGLASLGFAEEKTAAAAPALTVELKIGTGIENREVTGAADKFPAGTPQLAGWSRVTGAQEPVQIMHVWKHDGNKAASVPLSVKTSSFRTYSRIDLGGVSGKWTLEVQDMNEKVLASKDVEVEGAAAK